MEGADGKLKKQQVKTGLTLYGEYIEITEGITQKDWLAFPYTKGLKEGAPTKHSTQKELFGEMYWYKAAPCINAEFGIRNSEKKVAKHSFALSINIKRKLYGRF